MRKLEPEKIMEMLKAKGVDVTVEQAASILEFLRKMAQHCCDPILKTGGQ